MVKSAVTVMVTSPTASIRRPMVSSILGRPWRRSRFLVVIAVILLRVACHAVAHLAYGGNLCAGLAQLLAQGTNVHIEGAAFAEKVGAPHFIQQRFAR